MSTRVDALQPPDPGEIEQLKQSGEFDERLDFANSLGNHIMNPALLQNVQARILGEGEAPPGNVDMPATGSVKTLTILIEFSDYTHTNSASFIDDAIYGDGTASNFPRESLANYYDRSSYNQLDLSVGNVLGWYTTSYARSSVTQTRAGREALIKEVLNHYNSVGHNFSQYDNDSDGDIDYLVVIWTGPDNGWGNFWWGYKTSFSDSSYLLDGKRLSTYSWQWESRPVGGTFYPTVVIHETGHALGLPDYYDYDDTVGPDGGVGGLDMMDANKGDHNAFSKWMLGWLTPTIIPSGSQTRSLGNLSNYDDAVKIMPGATSSVFAEYFMIDNRYKTGNDSNMPGSGFLIWHVDARLSSGSFIYNNSYTSHKLLRVMEADGLEEIETGNHVGDAGDYYTQGDAIGAATTPDTDRYDGIATNVTVSNISATAATMSATFAITGSGNVPPSLEITQPDGVSDAGDTSYTVRWVDSDPDNNASIFLYYDNNSSGTDGTLIVSGRSEDSSIDYYVWNTTLVPAGSYYVYGIINDGVNSQVVDYSSGPVIISHGITEDNYEENDTLATAYDLSYDELTWLSTIDGLGVQSDEDWYKISVTSAFQRIQIDCRFDDSLGDIDIALYDANGEYLTSSTSTTDNEFIDYRVTAYGTHYIKVYYGNAGNSYDLWWDDLYSPDDLYEENDTQAAYYNIGSKERLWLSDLSGQGVQSDDDWYRITLTPGYERVQVDCRFTHSQGNINIGLYDSGGTLIASSVTSTDDEYIDFRVSGGTYYYIRVYGANAATIYDLWWDDLQDDSYEENDTRSTAYTSFYELGWLSAHRGLGEQFDEDWYRFYVTPGYEIMDINATFTHADGDINIELYDSSGSLVKAAATTTNNEYIDYLVSEGGAYYYLKVFGDNAGNTYNLWWDDIQVTDDLYEENDAWTSPYLYHYEGSWLTSPYRKGLGVQADSDWYRISMSPGYERIVVDCRFTHLDGNINIALYDEAGAFVKSSNSSTDNELIDVRVTGGTYFYILVSGANAGNTYDLWWDDLQDDSYEENDTLGTAYTSFGELGWLSAHKGLGEQFDDDWYSIYVTPGFEIIDINATFTHANGDINVELYNSSGNLVKASITSTDNEYIDYLVPTGGVYYYIKVFGANSGNTYNLWWDDIQATDDLYEENDTYTTAYVGHYEQYWLSSPSRSGLGIQADNDWYEIYVTPGFEKVLVDCRFTHSQGDIGVALYSSSGSLLRYINSGTDNEYLEHTVPVGGGYHYIRVYGANAGNLYNLWWDDVPNEPPTITLNQPDGLEDWVVQGSDYNIIWIDADPDSNASISLYRDTNNTGNDGTLIVSGILEDSANYYVWDTTGVPVGSYYIYAVINDGYNSAVTDYSSGMVNILAPCTSGICNPGFENSLNYWTKNGTPFNNNSTDAVEGTYSLRSEHTRTTSDGPAWSGVNQPINSVEPAQTYGISMSVKGTNASRGHVKIMWYNSGGTVSQVDYPIINLDGTFGWTAMSKLVTSPADAVSAKISIWHGLNASNQNVQGSVLFADNIEFDVATSACGTLCNESFEQGLLYWTVSGAVGSHNIETSGAHDGLKAAKSEQLYTSGDPAKWAGITQYAQVKAGTTYRFRFWLKKANLNSGHVRIRWRNSSGSLLSTEYPLSGISGTTATWYKREATVTAPASAAKAEISIWHGVNAGVNVPGSTMWIDDITMICLSLCNGGFEDGTVHWEANGKNDPEIFTSGPQEGAYAMRVRQSLTSSDQTQWAGISQRTMVTGGTTYNLNIWVYKWNTVQGHVKIKWRNSNDQLISQQFPVSGMNGTDTAWVNVPMVVTAPASAETAEIFIWHGVDASNNNATGSVLNMDNITFVPVP